MSLENAGRNWYGKGTVWYYTDSTGIKHRLRNNGYYSGWKCDMWESCWWSESKVLANGHVTSPGWGLGGIAPTRKQLIRDIENDINGVDE